MQDPQKEAVRDRIIRIGLDTSKSLSQLHGVNAAEQPVLRRQLHRGEMAKFFEKLPPAVIALEGATTRHQQAAHMPAIDPTKNVCLNPLQKGAVHICH